MNQVFDVAVIGGGINGCGSAADAALRGLSVILIEKDDLASKTSSASSKLIHGGLRYLEQYDFALVKKALKERQHLLDLAPHLVRPLPIVLPYQKHMRSSWLLRAGLYLYDNLNSKNELPHSKLIRRKAEFRYFSPLSDYLDKGFLFYDCSTDDSRLTITNALQAKKYGAIIKRNTTLVKAKVSNNLWQLTINSCGETQLIQARSLINASGPWVSSINKILEIPSAHQMSLVKGSHLLVPLLYEGNHAYLLQNEDGRIVFVLPYEGYTMIGTTDIAFEGSLDEISISSNEIDYLIKLVNSYFHCSLQKENIITTWSGVRPLLANLSENLSAISRDYSCVYSAYPAPNVTIYGGKITTYRQASADAIDLLKHPFPNLKHSQSAFVPLPGSQFNGGSFSDYKSYVREKYSWLAESIKARYLANYGSRTENLLAQCSKMSDLGQHFGSGLHQIEVDFLCKEEWAKSPDDILWRRSKLGLSFNDKDRQNLAVYLQSNSELIQN